MAGTGAAAWRTLGWATLFTAAALVGRATRLEDMPLAVVWPAAGIGILWHLLADGTRRYRVDMPVLAVASLAANAATGAGAGLSLLLAGGNLVNAVAGGEVLRRVSDLAQKGLRDNQGLLHVGAGALAGAVASAPTSVLALTSGDTSGATAVIVWILRYSSNSAVVMAVVLTWRARLADRRSGTGDTRPTDRTEVGAVLALSLLVHQIVFSLRPDESFSFATLPAVVLVGLRLGPAWTATHGLGVAVIGVAATVAGRGPFGAVESPEARLIVVQAFVAAAGLIGVVISLEVRQRQLALAHSDRRADALERTLQTAVVGNALVSQDPASRGEIRYANPALQRWWAGDDEAPLVGRSWAALLAPDDRTRFERVLDDLADGTRNAWAGELRHRVRSGEQRFCQVAVAQLCLPSDVDDQPDRPLANIQVLDITERKSLEARLLHQALHDHLTGLPNRALLEERIDHALASAERTGNGVALLYVDLDHFKEVNDSLGHRAGDDVLTTVASRLRGAVRPGDTVSRVGGDEFVVCCPDVRGPNEAAEVAERILHTVSRPMSVDGHEVLLGASIGGTIARPGSRAADLLSESDAAMYRAKSAGRATVELFDHAPSHRADRSLQLEAELHRAVEERQFVLHHQPIVDIGTGRLLAVEALVRWSHPSRGLLLPAEWLDVAEASGLMPGLGARVLHEALGQWPHLARIHGDELAVHVNVSAAQLRDRRLVDTVGHALRASGTPADHVVLELSESQLVSITDPLVAELHRIRALGVRLAADDVGGGSSSLAQLTTLPIDEIKIGRQFVALMATERRSRAVVHGIVAMAHAMDRTVIAEGVETEHDALRVTEAGCSIGQGFLWGRPREVVDLRAAEDVPDQVGRRAAYTPEGAAGTSPPRGR